MTSKEVGEFVEVSKLTLHPKNPRDNDSAVESISRSIVRFGFTSPIIANRENVVLCGNTRLKASRKLGLSVVPVVYVDLSPTEQELLMIADNKLGELSEWNKDKLSSLLTELNLEVEELDILGFENKELNELLGSFSNEPIGEDYTPPENEEFNLEEFEEFNHTCPRCNFEWNE